MTEPVDEKEKEEINRRHGRLANDGPGNHAPSWDEIMRERERKLAEMRRRGDRGCLYGCPEAKEIVSASLSRKTDILNYE